MKPVIEVEELWKIYSDGTEAVRGISFDVAQGEFFGFLGPNGAGKSTTIKILITLLAATRGRVRIFGLDASQEATCVRRLIGYAAQEVGVDDELTGYENLMLQGQLYHLESKLLRRRVDELLALMDLSGDAHRPAGSYSGGMRKRLDLATGLMHHPQVLFLDEPTTGLDPQNRAAIWGHLERINKEEKLTILLTTHYLEEADHLCDRLAIIDHGKIVVSGAPAALKAELGGDTVTLGFGTSAAQAGGVRRRAAEVLREQSFVETVSENDSKLVVITREKGRALPLIVRTLDEAGIAVVEMASTSPTLDDVFLKHTGAHIRDEAPVENWRNAIMPGGRGRISGSRGR
jgi:ABC-2 type transport system ATP-binding protein